MRYEEYKREEEDEDDEEVTIELRQHASRRDQAPTPAPAVESRQPVPSRPSISRLPRFPSSSSFALNFSAPSMSMSDRHHHSIQFPDDNSRSTAHPTPAGPLIEKLSTLVATGAGVLSSTTQMVNLDSMADSVAEAMSLLHNPFSAYGRKKDGFGDYLVDPKLGDIQEQRVRLKLQAFWQLLLTGFEVMRYSAGKRAKRQVLWMDLSGKLYLEVSKKERHAAKGLFWADVTHILKGSEAECFTQSQSWRDAKAKAHLSFSIHGQFGKEERVFAVQVVQSSVRNVLFENFEALLRMTKGDADGEYPSAAQKVVAQHYAVTGDVLTLRQVEDILLREEDERFSSKDGGSVDKKHASSIDGSHDKVDNDGDEHAGSSSDESDEDQQNILG